MPKSSIQTAIPEAVVCIKVCPVIHTSHGWWSGRLGEPAKCWAISENSVESWLTINLCGNGHLRSSRVWRYTYDFACSPPTFQKWRRGYIALVWCNGITSCCTTLVVQYLYIIEMHSTNGTCWAGHQFELRAKIMTHRCFSRDLVRGMDFPIPRPL